MQVVKKVFKFLVVRDLIQFERLSSLDKSPYLNILWRDASFLTLEELFLLLNDVVLIKSVRPWYQAAVDNV